MTAFDGAGRRSDLEAMFDQHMDAVWRFVRRRTSSAADADDVTAEVFATVCRRAAELPPEAERHLWLYGVARNVLRNHARSSERRRRLGARLLATRPEVTVGPDQPFDDGLLRALARLGEDDRDLLVMRAWDELSVTDMAVLLGTSPNAVSLRLTRARKRLAAFLDETAVLDETEEGPGGHERVDPEPRREGPRHG
jgi:RNA polymerase sigma-70 factor (ECF subfamily)